MAADQLNYIYLSYQEQIEGILNRLDLVLVLIGLTGG